MLNNTPPKLTAIRQPNQFLSSFSSRDYTLESRNRRPYRIYLACSIFPLLEFLVIMK
jgi:hypothetical protein